MAVEVLTRAIGLSEFKTPTGRQFTFAKVAAHPSLISIVATGDKSMGPLPNELVGEFTKESYAKEVLMKYLEKFWDMSDEAAKKSK